MTRLSQSEIDQNNPPSHYPAEDPIDLREYILTLGRWWREILLITILTALAAAAVVLGVRLISTPVYEAAATVVIVRTKSEVSFDERFVTQSDDQGVEAGYGRRVALLGLVSSGVIAEDVIAELDATLKPEQMVPSELLKEVRASFVLPPEGPKYSDLIIITATDGSPSQAADIANAWATAYVERVNTIYGQTPKELVVSVDQELAEAQSTYETAQANLESYIQSNDVDRLSQRIEDMQVTSDLQADQYGKLLIDFYDEWRMTLKYLEDARSLRAQVENGGEGAATTNSLALQLLKAQVFGSNAEGLVANLMVQVGDLTTLSQKDILEDIDSLIGVLEQRVNSFQGGIENLSSIVLAEPLDSGLAVEASVEGDVNLSTVVLPLSQAVAGLQQEILSLRAQLEKERAQQKFLVQERDLARETFQTLRNKVAELKLLGAAANSEVRLAAQAIIPSDPVPGAGLIRTVLLAAVVGFMLGVGIAFLADYMGVEPFLGRSNKPSAELQPDQARTT